MRINLAISHPFVERMTTSTDEDNGRDMLMRNRNRWVSLSGSALIGRGGEGLELQLVGPEVSRTHALIEYRGEPDSPSWFIRDLGSTNGTYVGRLKLVTGVWSPIGKKTILDFGTPGTESWEVLDDGPPHPGARTGTRWVMARDGVLTLPDEQQPELRVFARGHQWLAQTGLLTIALSDGAEVRAGGKTWNVILPALGGSGVPTYPADGAPLPVGVRIWTPPDRKRVLGVHLTVGAQAYDLGCHAHHELLRVLALARLEDDHLSEPPDEQGWLYIDELLERLQLTKNNLDVWTSRLKNQLRAAPVPIVCERPARGLIQRRVWNCDLSLVDT